MRWISLGFKFKILHGQCDVSSLLDLLLFFYSFLMWKWTFEFACLQEASREAAPPTDEPSSGQRPGSSCNSLRES